MKRISIGRICPGVGIILIIAVTGCAPKTDIPWETFAQSEEPYKPRANSGNAWDEYLLAANLATKATEKWASAADIRPADEKEYLNRIQNALNVATRASTLPCHEEFVPSDPFLPRPAHSGLTAIGQGLGIQIKQAEKNQNVNGAAGSIIAAHRIADHLTQGDAQDALIGFWIASNARAQSADKLQKMDARVLKNIGNAILASLKETADPNKTIDHEYKNMLLGVQFVQDAHKAKDYELLNKAFYKQAAPAIEYLEGMRDPDRPKYFKDFAEEAKLFADYARTAVTVPASERKSIDLTLSGERPWKRFSQHLFTPIITFLESRDRHIARSRLFALTCLAIAEGKSTGKAPAEFIGLGEATIDPYNGKPFPYQRAEREFKIYSVGIDGRDDGGETKGRGLEPDVTIEPPAEN